MQIRGIRLPASETFPCAQRVVKEVFATDDLAWVSFGSPIRSFRFDNRASRRPILIGPVIASMTMNREREAHLCVYPVARSAYPKSAAEEFQLRVLPKFREWLEAKKSRPKTAILGHQQIIVEWTGDEHRCHELRFL